MVSRRQIYDVIKGNPTGVTSSVIGRQLGISIENASARVAELRKGGFVKRINAEKPFKYAITTKRALDENLKMPKGWWLRKRVEQEEIKQETKQEQRFRKRQRRGNLQELRDQIHGLNQLLAANFEVPVVLRLEDKEGVQQIKAIVEL